MPGNAGWCGCNGRWMATAILRPNPAVAKRELIHACLATVDVGRHENGSLGNQANPASLEVVKIHRTGRLESERRDERCACGLLRVSERH